MDREGSAGEKQRVRSWDIGEDRVMAEGHLETCEHEEAAEMAEQCCNELA